MEREDPMSPLRRGTIIRIEQGKGKAATVTGRVRQAGVDS
jgi:hypothetical protein